ncbi:Putative multidrug export ATP-binding/permease protein [Sedimentisphaera cyanobacteriorum]|uniref:Multidrug export ATP-binding/permease protein n=1 Tax=Sedimentisphaera cyanobacteriorum TaxID=1940790 RepID=A0A1Q2HRR2_9BACT|nr:ABC transporter ATP-binding protein [Sedimentisphaera cyanobacteriorum]AQQ10112.1 Putative multidrug export ATP-binding/permease protein [Sedimentisphaera cyanobacteriorum]
MLKKFIQYYKPHKGLLILSLGAAVIGSAITVFIPVITRRLLNDHLPEENMQAISISIAVLFGMVTAASILAFIRVKWGHILGVRMETDMRADIFRHIQKLSFNYFDNVKTGHIMSRISNDLNQIAEIAHHAPEDLLISAIVIIGAFIMMFSFNPILAGAALIPLIIIISWGILYGGMMRKGFRRVRRKIADINSSVENSVQGIREVKAFANEPEEIEKFHSVNYSFKRAKERMYGIMSIFFSVMTLLTESYFLVVICVGVFLIKADQLTAGDLVAFILYVHLILKPIQRLVNFSEQLQRGFACFERFIEIMEIEPDIVDCDSPVELSDVQGHIEFENLSFSYDGKNYVLKDLNLTIPANKTAALVGESGAGKSTIVSLVPRFYEPQNGRITIDGVDIMKLKRRFLRENIGIVQQSAFLFDATIRENIMYGKLDASEEEIIEAARKANILKYIQSLPDGFDTLVGERGVKLSGGQKQRLSIARVFLKNPPIFIFDEATSALDSESEALIQSSLELLSKDRTTIVIAHRLSTVRDADKIIVLKDGRKTEEGSHEELIASGGQYHSFYTMNVL